MNAITEVPAVSAETLEHVLGTGDLSKLTVPQRVEYYRRTCESLGLNPLTRPIRFLTLNGTMQLYFTRDGTDQLRKVNGITLHVVDRVAEAGVYSVTVRARDKHGREDEDIGAVVLPQGGESRANALMKAITKAKRRVTLSICGLGQTDESELDTMPGARVFDAEDEPPVVPIRTVSEPGTREAINDAVPLTPKQQRMRGVDATGKPWRSAEGEDADRAEAAERERAAAAATPRPERKIDPTVYDAPPEPAPEKRTWAQWKDALELAVKDAKTPEERGRLIARAEVVEIVRLARLGPYSPAKARIIELYEEVENRYLADPPDPPEPDLSDEALGEVVVTGEDKVMAG